MDRPRFIAFWVGLALSFLAAALIAGPVYREMLPANIPSQPGTTDAEVIGLILAWIFGILIFVISLCVAGGTATLTLVELNLPDARMRFGLPGLVLFFAVLVFVYDGFLRSETAGVFRDFYGVLGTGVEKVEIIAVGARRAAAVGSSVGLLVFSAMVGLTYRRRSWAHSATESDERDVELVVVRRRIGQLKDMLLWAGLGLASGVVASAMRLTLQIDFAQPVEHVEVARTIVRSITIAYGAVFTLWLLLGYVPASIVLTRWSQRLSAEALPTASAAERKKWRVSEGLEAPAMTQAWQLLAAFAPFLTSALGEPLTNVLTGLIPI